MRGFALTLAVVAVVGCGGPTTILVSIAVPDSTTADKFAITVFDRNGLVVDHRDLGSSAKLPGGVLVLMSRHAGVARVLVVATLGGAFAGEAAGAVPVVPGERGQLTLLLVESPLAEGDADGVPDTIDNCPT